MPPKENITNRLELKKMNRRRVYHTLLDKEQMTKLDISYLTGLSIPTVTQNLNELMEEGLVESVGAQQSTGGRRAKAFQCIKDARYAVGVDVTLNHITIAVLNLAADIVCASEQIRFVFQDEEQCYEHIKEMVDDLLESNRIDKERILGIGVSFPSIVDRRKNLVTYSEIVKEPANVVERLSRIFPYRVEVYNDANSAGYAELKAFEKQGIQKEMIFYMMVSRSVGGAILQNSAIYLGENCRSAEIGHTKIIPEGKLCYCGQKGCVNAYCSTNNLVEATKGGTLSDFFRDLKAGNGEYRKLFDEYLAYLADAIENMRMIMDCDIVIGGYLGEFIDPYLDELKDKVLELNPYDNNAEFIVPCMIKKDASAAGTALDFIEHFINEV